MTQEPMTPAPQGETAIFGPYDNACTYCGVMLLTGHKQVHIKHHYKQEPELKPVKQTSGTMAPRG